MEAPAARHEPDEVIGNVFEPHGGPTTDSRRYDLDRSAQLATHLRVEQEKVDAENMKRHLETFPEEEREAELARYTEEREQMRLAAAEEKAAQGKVRDPATIPWHVAPPVEEVVDPNAPNDPNDPNAQAGFFGQPPPPPEEPSQRRGRKAQHDY